MAWQRNRVVLTHFVAEQGRACGGRELGYTIVKVVVLLSHQPFRRVGPGTLNRLHGAGAEALALFRACAPLRTRLHVLVVAAMALCIGWHGG